MRLWLSRGSEVTLKDQLVTQVILSILSGELKPGQRLPSTRELARRFHIHANTVSAGYRKLARDQWVEFLRGSGIFVRKQRPEGPSAAIALDQLITSFFQSAREMGANLSTVRSRLRQLLEAQPPDHFLLIEPDAALAQILISEIQTAVTLPVKSCGTDGDLAARLLAAVPVVLSMNEKLVRRSLSDSADLLVLHMGSPGASLALHLPAPSTALVGVASSWPAFLKTARTMLIAAGFPPECLVLRDASKANWQRGLKQVAAVVCDSLTAHELQDMARVLVFPLLADSCLQNLKSYEEFLRQPFAP